MANFIVWLFTPLAILVIMLMACGVLIFHFICRLLNRRPTVDEEEKFIENVGKMMDDGHPEAYARREVFKRLFQK